MISPEGWKHTLDTNKIASAVASGPNMTKEATATDDQKEQTSSIIIAALVDHALRVFRSVGGRPNEKKKKPDAWYNCKFVVSRISKMFELVSI